MSRIESSLKKASLKTEFKKCLSNQSHCVVTRIKQNNVHESSLQTSKNLTMLLLYLLVINLECMSECKHFCGGFYLFFLSDIVQIKRKAKLKS